MQVYRLVKDIGAGRGGFVIRKQNRVMALSMSNEEKILMR